MPRQREIEELLQFIYLMPVAVVRLGETGAVELLNPRAVQLLQDLDIDVSSGDGEFILERLRPGLRQLWRDSTGHLGDVTPAQRISPLPPGARPFIWYSNSSAPMSAARCWCSRT